MRSGKVINGLFWRFLERCCAQGVTFVVSIILARRLGPEAYGTVSLVTVFTTLLQVFIDSGFGNSLIQKKDADDLDFSSVFYFNIVLSVVLYGIMYVAAPLIARFYEMPELTAITRVLCLVVVIAGVKNIQQAYVSRHMQFRSFFYASLGGTIGSAVIGIWMAYSDFGVWALVAQSLSNRAINTAILWITVKWRPRLIFSWQRLKGLLSFGWKLLAARLLDTVYTDLRSLIIGKLYGASDLAYYNKGAQVPRFVVNNINVTINSVLFPTMSAEQDKVVRVRAMARRAIRISTYVMMPMMMGIAVCAEPLIRILLGTKWLPCVPFLRIFCFTYAFYPIATANLNAIQALGRSDLFLKLEIWKKAIGLVALFCTIWVSVEAMAYSLLVTSVIAQLINASPNKRLLNYPYIEQLRDMLPQILLSCVMGAVVYPVTFLGWGPWQTLLVQVPLGIAVYVLGSVLLHFDSFDYILGILRGYWKKLRGRKNGKERKDGHE